MAFYMATTKISTDKTAGEVGTVLAKFGASDVLTKYENGEAIGISFIIKNGDKGIPFKLPINWKTVLTSMQADRKTPRNLCNEEQAKRVAWRLVLRWVQSQLAFIEAGGVKIEEVFLPYAQKQNGQTVYEAFAEQKFKLLGSGS